jgi:uncharacterized protein with HEPN domain
LHNALIHAYQNIDNETVWRTTRDSLPLLRARVATLLAELGETP